MTNSRRLVELLRGDGRGRLSPSLTDECVWDAERQRVCRGHRRKAMGLQWGKTQLCGKVRFGEGLVTHADNSVDTTAAAAELCRESPRASESQMGAGRLGALPRRNS